MDASRLKHSGFLGTLTVRTLCLYVHIHLPAATIAREPGSLCWSLHLFYMRCLPLFQCGVLTIIYPEICKKPARALAHKYPLIIWNTSFGWTEPLIFGASGNMWKKFKSAHLKIFFVDYLLICLMIWKLVLTAWPGIVCVCLFVYKPCGFRPSLGGTGRNYKLKSQNKHWGS